MMGHADVSRGDPAKHISTCAKYESSAFGMVLEETSTSGRLQASEGFLEQGLALLEMYGRPYMTALVKCGPVPGHIAFIMDGNRRFATRHHQISATGHRFGYYKLLDALEWCLDIGITCVSAYAFSIDNFKRPSDEVAMLMKLAEEKLEELLHERDLVERHGVQVRVLGDLTLLPATVQAAAQRAMEATKLHTRGILNICFSYGSRQEMAQAVGKVQSDVTSGALPPNDVSPKHIEQHLYTKGCLPVDLLIRTSGETRLSDFLCWQVRNAQIVFANVLWPDFSFFDLLRALLQYQMAFAHLKSLQLAP